MEPPTQHQYPSKWLQQLKKMFKILCFSLWSPILSTLGLATQFHSVLVQTSLRPPGRHYTSVLQAGGHLRKPMVIWHGLHLRRTRFFHGDCWAWLPWHKRVPWGVCQCPSKGKESRSDFLCWYQLGWLPAGAPQYHQMLLQHNWPLNQWNGQVPCDEETWGHWHSRGASYGVYISYTLAEVLYARTTVRT